MGLDCLKAFLNKEEKNNEEDFRNQEKLDYIQKNNKNNFQNMQEKKDLEKGLKNPIYEIIANIQQNMEEDETKGLSIDYLDDFINSIFPENFPSNLIEDIKSKIYEIKNIELGEENKIRNFYKLQDLGNKQCFYFICSIKKITENSINIAYKFKILDVNIQNVEINKNSDNESNEKEIKENQKLINNVIDTQYNKLNQLL